MMLKSREHQRSEHAVLIVGAGPTGLMLAGELALAKVDVALVERRLNQNLAGTRAGGFHARSLEVLDQRGILDRFMVEGQKLQIAGYGMIPLDISDFPTRHHYGLVLKQERMEHILAAWVQELGVPIIRGEEVTSLSQDKDSVTLELASGSRLRSRYVVGCDGGRSVVRKSAGIDFKGWDASVSYLIAEAELAEEGDYGVRRGEKGVNAIGKMEDGKRVRIVLIEDRVVLREEPSEDELRQALTSVYGKDFGVHSITWMSRFSDAARQAVSYRKDRVLIAGDAAHVHSPTGGQGLNTGIQDAMNLGWKLAQVVHGQSPDVLLDSYTAERHPVGARVLRHNMAQTALMRGDDRTEALREQLAQLLKMNEPRKTYAGIMSSLDLHYDFGGGHPLLGRRMPDLDLITAGGPRRVYEYLKEARPLFLQFSERIAYDIFYEQVLCVRARSEGPWELPVLGPVAPPEALLIRPDGHVAWVGEGTTDGLAAALHKWFGAPAPGEVRST